MGIVNATGGDGGVGGGGEQFISTMPMGADMQGHKQAHEGGR